MMAQAGLEFSVSRRKQLAVPLHRNSLLAESQFRPVDLLEILPITVYRRVLKPWALVPTSECPIHTTTTTATTNQSHVANCCS